MCVCMEDKSESKKIAHLQWLSVEGEIWLMYTPLALHHTLQIVTHSVMNDISIWLEGG